nr:DNA polymerase eta [Tanacetum cinerariifolium]
MEVVAPIVDDNNTCIGILLFNKWSYDDIQDVLKNASMAWRIGSIKDWRKFNDFHHAYIRKNVVWQVVSILPRNGRCECASIDEAYLDLDDSAKRMLKEMALESLESLDEDVLKSLG